MNELQKSAEAERLLNDPAFRDAIGALVSGIHAKMRQVPIGDEKMHTRLILLLQCAESIEGYLRQAVQTGEMVKIEEEKRKRMAFFR